MLRFHPYLHHPFQATLLISLTDLDGSQRMNLLRMTDTHDRLTQLKLLLQARGPGGERVLCCVM